MKWNIFFTIILITTLIIVNVVGQRIDSWTKEQNKEQVAIAIFFCLYKNRLLEKYKTSFSLLCLHISFSLFISLSLSLSLVRHGLAISTPYSKPKKIIKSPSFPAPARSMAFPTEPAIPYRLLGEESLASASNPTDAVMFFGLSLVLGIACRHVLRGTRVPYTVALLVLGIALGSIGLSSFLQSQFHFNCYFSFINLLK